MGSSLARAGLVARGIVDMSKRLGKASGHLASTIGLAGKQPVRLGPIVEARSKVLIDVPRQPDPGPEGMRVAEWLEVMINQEVKFGSWRETEYPTRLLRNLVQRVRCGEHLLNTEEATAFRRAGKLPPLID